MGKAVLIIGMHRSGTSALAGLLSRLGLELGSELIPPKKGENDLGFYENRPICLAHDALLASFGSDWNDLYPLPHAWREDKRLSPFKEQINLILREELLGSPLWGVKDPRLCRLFPLWIDILAGHGIEPKVVIIFRHPSEVARSLQLRNGFSLEKSYLLWLDHLLSAECLTRGFQRVCISYEQLLGDWASVVTLIGENLNLDWPIPPKQIEDDVERFLLPDLRHHREEKQPGELTGLPILDRVYQAMCVAVPGHWEAQRQIFDDARSELRQYQTLFSCTRPTQSQARNEVSGVR